MKWLLLAFLMSCGHESPPARDVGDSDGDQIPNYLEAAELQRYVAEVRPFGKAEGTLTFKLDNKFETVNLGNKSDLLALSMKLLTKSMQSLRSEEYFSEWARLKVDQNSYRIPDGQYEVTLNLETSEKPRWLAMTHDKSETLLGEFTSRMQFNLNAEELQQILNGKMFFTMKRPEAQDRYSVENTVRERTYRVFYSDGYTSKIHYVSLDLPFGEYKRLQGITEAYELKNFRGFTQNSESVLWWSRKIGEKDQILVKTSLIELSKFNFSNYDKKESSISRRNGSPSDFFEVTKSPGVKFVLKIRGNKTHHVFSESSRSSFRGGERNGRSCRDWRRDISGSRQIQIVKSEVLAGLVLTAAGKDAFLHTLVHDVTEGVDAKGWYLEFAFDETPEQFHVSLASKPKETFYRTGIYKTVCDNGRPEYGGTLTNEESQMDLQIESYIEKID